MLNNKILIILIGFILGLIARYIYSNSPYHKKVLKSNPIPKQAQKGFDNHIIKKIKNDKIPIFIQKDLNLDLMVKENAENIKRLLDNYSK